VIALIVGAGLLVGLAIAEGLVRLFDLAPDLPSGGTVYVPDPYLPYKPKPFTVAHGKRGGEFRHNSLGFRDVEHVREKPPGVFRILGLGDSFTYGALSPFEKTYLYRLEEELNRRPGNHPRVEIIKAGVSRYYPEPERILLEHYGAPFSPDLILVGFLPNDVLDTSAGMGAVRADRSGVLLTKEAAELGDFGYAIYRKSHLARLILWVWGVARAKMSGSHADEVYQANGFHERDWKTIEEEYSRMVSIADRLHARLVIVHIPHRGPWRKKHEYPAKRLGEWASRNHAGFVDALPDMKRASGREPLYWADDGHCTPAGYGVIAAAIYDYLVQNRLVP
jgi:lysophospholipase L1-like esterase